MQCSIKEEENVISRMAMKEQEPYREESKVGCATKYFKIILSNQSNVSSHGLELVPILTTLDGEAARCNPSVEQSLAAAAWQRYVPWQ